MMHFFDGEDFRVPHLFLEALTVTSSIQFQAKHAKRGL